jgi:hypothetical protein
MNWNTFWPAALMQQYVAAVTDFTRAVDAIAAGSASAQDAALAVVRGADAHPLGSQNAHAAPAPAAAFQAGPAAADHASAASACFNALRTDKRAVPPAGLSEFRSPPVGIVDQGADVPVVASGVATISELIAAELSCETMLFLFQNAPW